MTVGSECGECGGSSSRAARYCQWCGGQLRDMEEWETPAGDDPPYYVKYRVYEKSDAACENRKGGHTGEKKTFEGVYNEDSPIDCINAIVYDLRGVKSPWELAYVNEIRPIDADSDRGGRASMPSDDHYNCEACGVGVAWDEYVAVGPSTPAAKHLGITDPDRGRGHHVVCDECFETASEEIAEGE